jgi:hypothetical protein
VSFVKDDGKGFVAAHTASTAFESWPEFGEMLGARYDGHPWNTAYGSIINEDASFPATKHLPLVFNFTDEFYQRRHTRGTRFACCCVSTCRRCRRTPRCTGPTEIFRSRGPRCTEKDGLLFGVRPCRLHMGQPRRVPNVFRGAEVESRSDRRRCQSSASEVAPVRDPAARADARARQSGSR